MELEPSIQAQIDTLPPKLKSQFEEELLDMINRRYWCKAKGINYVHPERDKAREALFKERYQGRVLESAH
jgi:hypothetical protein